MEENGSYDKSKAHFKGYASKADLLCSDGRTIMAHAFKDQHDTKVPLVWNHIHDDNNSVLGHAYLEDRPDGTYVYGYLNNTDSAKNALEQLAHGDFESLSVYANRLVQRGHDVIHGVIREVSLVLAGANPGARIEQVSLQHSDGSIERTDTEAVIHTGLQIEMGAVIHADGDEDETEELDIKTIVDGMSDEEQQVLAAIADRAFRDGAKSVLDPEEDEDDDTTDNKTVEHSDDSTEIKHSDNDKDDSMTHSVFDSKAGGKVDLKEQAGRSTLSHSQLMTIFDTAKKPGHTLKSAILQHSAEFGIFEGTEALQHAEGDYGVTNIEYVFPEAKLVGQAPQLISRQMEWVGKVIDGVHKTPYANVLTLFADITAEEARARGYKTGNLKKEEVVKLLRRKTTPTTIYKKQKLDRDNILDATEIDVVTWLWGEMILMLNEEIARAILLGDGRPYTSDDKVDEDNIRPIATDDPFYTLRIEIPQGSDPADIEKAILYAQDDYRGTGNPTMWCRRRLLTNMVTREDGMGRRLYRNRSELADVLMVKEIVPVELMDSYTNLLAVIVNLSDYNVGTNRGGQITKFEDFDIDYNQHKYLAETRISGALIKPSSAIAIWEKPGITVTPDAPSFEGSTNTITIPTQTGVSYYIESDRVTGEVVIEEDVEVKARPESGYGFSEGATTSWNFTYTP